MKPRYVLFDCDGVLIFENQWLRLHRLVGIPDEVDRQWYEAYRRGTLSYGAWVREIGKLYRDTGVTRDTFKRAYARFDVNPEAPDVVRRLHERDIKTAVLSGGIDMYVSAIAELLGIPRWKAFTSPVFAEDGAFLEFTFQEEDDAVFKAREVWELAHAEKCHPREFAHVGDSKNDVLAFAITGNGIAYNCPDPEIRKLARMHAHRLDEIFTFLE